MYQGHLAISRDFLIVTNGVLLLVSSGCRPVLLLTIHTNFPSSTCQPVKGENLCSRSWLLVRVSFSSCLAAKQKCSLCSLILFYLLFLKYPQSPLEFFPKALLSSQRGNRWVKITRKLQLQDILIKSSPCYSLDQKEQTSAPFLGFRVVFPSWFPLS